MFALLNNGLNICFIVYRPFFNVVRYMLRYLKNVKDFFLRCHRFSLNNSLIWCWRKNLSIITQDIWLVDWHDWTIFWLVLVFKGSLSLFIIRNQILSFTTNPTLDKCTEHIQIIFFCTKKMHFWVLFSFVWFHLQLIDVPGRISQVF